MTTDWSEFHQAFYEESLESLGDMERSLLHLSSDFNNPEDINTLFRVAHSLKGGSGMFGFTAMESFTHVMETVLDSVRSGGTLVTQEVVEILLESVDCLRETVTAMQQGRTHDVERTENLKAHLESFRSHAEQCMQTENGSRRGDAGPLATSVAPTGANGWRIHVRPHSHLFRTGSDPCRLFQELATLGELEATADYSKLPGFLDLDPENCYLGWELVLLGDMAREEISAILEWIEGECEVAVDAIIPKTDDSWPRVVVGGPTRPQAEPVRCTDNVGGSFERSRRLGNGRRRTSAAVSDGSSIRVSIDKVDVLINMVGELVITQSMLSECGKSLTRDHLDKLRTGLVQLARNTRELQEGVLRIRMLPIRYAFNCYPRLVHDLSRKLGKRVEIKVSGEQTELDKTVMEKIGDPLVHLIRNAVDHGIEAPEVRIASGKRATGVLHLNAYHQGGNIIIEVSDDGAGLDAERIRARAQQCGLIGENEKLPKERIHELIFQPGFSTAERLTDVSGRGVGMDVVRRNINDLGGVIEILSEEGLGSTFTIRLPLTLAILDGQLVRVGRHIYIIPLVSIVESLQIDYGRVSQVAGQAEIYKLRDRFIPIIRLYRLFNVVPDTNELEKGLLVVVERDGQRAGFFVDELLAQQQVVIKSLETNYKRTDGVSGATILGDGRVALILDIHGLITLAQNQPLQASAVESTHSTAA